MAKQLVIEYPSQWNQATANQTLQQLQPYVKSYIIATKQEYQCPTSVNNFSIEVEMCDLNLLRDYAQIAQFAAFTEAGRGNTELAKEYAVSPINVGLTMVQSDNVTLIEYLVGLASINIGLDTLKKLEQEDVLSQAEIAQLLKGLYIPTESMRTPLQREYVGFRIAITDNLELPQTYIYHQNRTRNELYDFMSKVIENSTRDCFVASSNALSPTDSELIEYVENIQSKSLNPILPNMIGNVYLSVIANSLNSVHKSVCDVNQRITNLTD